MTLPTSPTSPTSPDDPIQHSDPTIDRLLARYAARLRTRPGLSDRILAAVERELEAPAVLASIGGARWRRSLAAAAVVLIACGVAASLVLRSSSRGDGGAPTTDLLMVAEGSHAERMLVALAGAADDDASMQRHSMLDEIIPGSGVQFEELDREVRLLLGESARAGRGAER